MKNSNAISTKQRSIITRVAFLLSCGIACNFIFITTTLSRPAPAPAQHQTWMQRLRHPFGGGQPQQSHPNIPMAPPVPMMSQQQHMQRPMAPMQGQIMPPQQQQPLAPGQAAVMPQGQQQEIVTQVKQFETAVQAASQQLQRVPQSPGNEQMMLASLFQLFSKVGPGLQFCSNATAQLIRSQPQHYANFNNLVQAQQYMLHAAQFLSTTLQYFNQPNQNIVELQSRSREIEDYIASIKNQLPIIQTLQIPRSGFFQSDPARALQSLSFNLANALILTSTTLRTLMNRKYIALAEQFKKNQ